MKTFSEGSSIKPDFAACYVKTGTTFALWNTVATNAFFEKNCGADTEDYFKNTKYTVKTLTPAEEGVGLGTEIVY